MLHCQEVYGHFLRSYKEATEPATQHSPLVGLYGYEVAVPVGAVVIDGDSLD